MSDSPSVKMSTGHCSWFAFERNILTGQFRDDRDRPERQAQSNYACNDAHQRAFENKQSHDAAPLCSERHAQGDLTLGAREAHEQ